MNTPYRTATEIPTPEPKPKLHRYVANYLQRLQELTLAELMEYLGPYAYVTAVEVLAITQATIRESKA